MWVCKRVCTKFCFNAWLAKRSLKLIPLCIRGLPICIRGGRPEISHIGSPCLHNKIVRILGATYTCSWILEPSVYIEWLWDQVTGLCHCLLLWLASSIESHHLAGMSIPPIPWPIAGNGILSIWPQLTTPKLREVLSQVPLGQWSYFLILSHGSLGELWDRIKIRVVCMGRSWDIRSLSVEMEWMRELW